MKSVCVLDPRPDVRPTSPLVGLAMLLLATRAQAQIPVELTSVAWTTNGAKLAWTDPAPGQVFTVHCYFPALRRALAWFETFRP
jgi:hypothetical protein